MQEQVTDKLLRVAQDCDDITQAVHEVLIADENTDVPLTDGTTTPSLSKRVKQFGSQVTKVVDKVGEVSAEDIANALGLGTAAKQNASDLMQAKNLKMPNGDDQYKINTAFYGNRWLAALYGISPSNPDNHALLQDIISNKMKDGDILVLNPAQYKISKPLTINKVIKVESTIRSQSLTATLDCASGGLIIEKPYCMFDNISIKGTTTATVFDFENRVFGNVGIKNSYSTGKTSGGTILGNLFVSGFDVNLLEAQETGQGWAGAYREYYNLFLTYGRINYLALDGATHTVFHGGGIQAALENGIYAKATFNGGSEQSYNNIAFLGTTVESNGFHTDNFTNENWRRIGIYAGANTKLGFFGGYSEKQSVFSEDGGRINFYGSHQHANSRLFSNSSVNDDGGEGAKQSKLFYQQNLAPLFASTTATIKNVLVGDKKMRIQSSNSGGNTLIYTASFPLKGLLGRELDAVKFGFSWNIVSGREANPNLAIVPILRFVSTTAGSSDTSRLNYDYPLQILQKPSGYMEFFTHPRDFGTPYLDPNAELATMQIQFHFRNGDTDANFSTENLDAYISNMYLTVYGEKEISLSLDLPRSGATAAKPSNLSAFEAGFGYYDTQLSQYEIWNGSSWVAQAKQSDVLPQSVTQTQLSSSSESINTTGKLRGRFAYNSTNGKMYFALGVNPTSAWRATDNSGDITPV